MSSETQRATGHEPAVRVVRVVAAGTHLAAIVTWILGPLLVLWVGRDEFLRENARHALNWQLTIGLVLYVAGALLVVHEFIPDSRFVLWSFALLQVALGGTLLFATVAAVRAARGECREYPLAIPIVETTTISRTF